jgi:hypothetical protein
MIAVAQDAQGAARVAPALADIALEFPVLLDESSAIARELGFRIVPAGALLDANGRIVYASDADFDIGDPRLRVNLETFMSGGRLEPQPDRPLTGRALELFAQGVCAHGAGDKHSALALWREALTHDPDNFLIRSQIWADEHPDRFWPVVDRDWQQRQLIKEGYEGPLP